MLNNVSISIHGWPASQGIRFTFPADDYGGKNVVVRCSYIQWSMTCSDAQELIDTLLQDAGWSYWIEMDTTILVPPGV